MFHVYEVKTMWHLQERDKLLSLEGKYAELSEGQTLTNNPVTIKEVGVGYSNAAALSG